MVADWEHITAEARTHARLLVKLHIRLSTTTQRHASAPRAALTVRRVKGECENHVSHNPRNCMTGSRVRGSWKQHLRPATSQHSANITCRMMISSQHTRQELPIASHIVPKRACHVCCIRCAAAYRTTSTRTSLAAHFPHMTQR